jgi:hypothetical protein
MQPSVTELSAKILANLVTSYAAAKLELLALVQ